MEGNIMTMGNWKIGKTLTVLLALVLCLTAALPGVRASAQTEYLSGDWEEATLEDENWIWTVYAFRFDSTLYDCTAFDLEMEVTMNYGARCKNWDIWVGYRGTYTQVGTMYLADGDGYTSKTVRLSSPTTFDAVAVTPSADGSYSWSQYLDVSNPVFDGGRDSDSHSDSDLDQTQDAQYLTGQWKAIKLGTASTHAFVFDEPLRRCTSLTIDMDVTMDANTHCYRWKVWYGNGDSYSELGYISLPAGDGAATKTFRFGNNARSFESIAITPIAGGSFSYSMGFAVYDVKYQ